MARVMNLETVRVTPDSDHDGRSEPVLLSAHGGQLRVDKRLRPQTEQVPLTQIHNGGRAPDDYVTSQLENQAFGKCIVSHAMSHGQQPQHRPR
jgi:pyocin large subunit-like protein